MNKALPTLLALLTATPTIQAAISYTLNGGVIATNFDALPTTGTNVVWANDSTITGWNLFTKDSAAITAIDAGTGCGEQSVRTRDGGSGQRWTGG